MRHEGSGYLAQHFGLLLLAPHPVFPVGSPGFSHLHWYFEPGSGTLLPLAALRTLAAALALAATLLALGIPILSPK